MFKLATFPRFSQYGKSDRLQKFCVKIDYLFLFEVQIRINIDENFKKSGDREESVIWCIRQYFISFRNNPECMQISAIELKFLKLGIIFFMKNTLVCI